MKRAVFGIILLAFLLPACGSAGYIPPDQNSYPVDLTQPLPAPRQVAITPLNLAAKTLAEETLSGGENRLPALVAALQISGAAIRSGDDGLAVHPATPWQGIIYETWEIPLLARMLDDESSITFGLTDLAEGLSKALPILKDVPLTQLVLKELRDRVAEQDGPARFWSLYIIELGRHATAHKPYDILANPDPNEVQLDAVQTSLILRLLVVDLFSFAGETPPGVTFQQNRRGWLDDVAVQPAYAQVKQPCTLDSDTKTILDISNWGIKALHFGVGVGDYRWRGIISYLQGSPTTGALTAVDKYKLGTSGAGILLAYSKIIYAYLALRAETVMDNPPLIRTKHTGAPGETKRVTATLMMDSDGQLINCLRTITNMAGLDFSVPQKGPVKNLKVTWVGDQGFKQAAQALSGGGSAFVAFAGNIVGQRTDANGRVQVNVNGIAQKKEISEQARQIERIAKLHLAVALTGGDLFKDSVDAIKAASSGPKVLYTLPADLYSRMQSHAVGHYQFKVIDWAEGCLGTIKFVYIEKLSGEEGDFKWESNFVETQIWEINNYWGNDTYESIWVDHIKGLSEGSAAYPRGKYFEKSEVEGATSTDPLIQIELPQSSTPPYNVRIKQLSWSNSIPPQQPESITGKHGNWCNPEGDCTDSRWEDTEWHPLPKSLDIQFEISQSDVTELKFQIPPKQVEARSQFLGSVPTSKNATEAWEFDLKCK